MDIVSKCVEELGVENAIVEKIDLLYDRLKEERESGDNQGLDALLPTISIFINYASTRQKLRGALQWLRETRGIEARDEAMWMLAALTLRQVVDVGLSRHADDPEKVAAWTEMRNTLAAGLDKVLVNSAQPVANASSAGV